MEFMTDRLLHGGDYNPEQWMDHPDILEKDLEMLVQAHCSVVTLGIFSWSTLEPEEGVYQMDWLADIIDRVYERGIRVILATPSGARPHWLADRYPSVLRVDEFRRKQLFGLRHNHCYTSLDYREKTAMIDRKLAERFGKHPAVILWHISNELGGECHCELCQEAFRGWLRKKYGTVERLNTCWSTTFWSHTYQSFDQVESPSPIGENQLHGLNLDWKRFVTDQTADFLRNEIHALREGGSELPVTTNLMYYFRGLDYFRLAKELDVVSWDTYPLWYKKEMPLTAADNAMCHDLMRSLLKKPFLQMESCPSATNWQGVSKLKKPGLLFAQSMQAIAHGSDGALYFQIRQSRGASEKFHGAVIDHYGGTDTRVFREVTQIGETLDKLSFLAGSQMRCKTAILYDWDSIWAMEDSQGPRNDGLPYHKLLQKIYTALQRNGLETDFVDEDSSLDDYRLLIIPMGYMFKEDFDRKVRTFVENGGLLLTTFWSGIADDTDRCWLGGTPHGLMDVLGIRSQEIDGLYDWEENRMVPVGKTQDGMTSSERDGVAVTDKELSDGDGAVTSDQGLSEDEGAGTTDKGLSEGEGVASGDKALPMGETAVTIDKEYSCRNLCELVELRGAHALMTYGEDFYQGSPAVTEHAFGSGMTWHVCCDAEEDFFTELLAKIAKAGDLRDPLLENLVSCTAAPGRVLPKGLAVTSRYQGKNRYLIAQNFGKEEVTLALSEDMRQRIEGDPVCHIPVLGMSILKIVGEER